MEIPISMPRLKGFRDLREIIACAVWAPHRFALNAADVEELQAERGVIVSRETIWLWVTGHTVSVFDLPVDPPGPLGGGQREGTADYALWRKQGARYLPVGGEKPTGLPNTMRRFDPV